jgi:hypothetical protein
MLQFEMPCLKPEGLAVFTQTPEQRLLLGVEWFTATHVPMQLRQYVRGEPKNVSEEELFSQLQQFNRRVGNHVVVLYGAAGSGKSEYMSWLEQRFKHDEPQRTIVRIARTELDVLSIVNKLRYMLTGEYFTQATVRRWEEMRRKPRTLAKLLILHALERLLDSDDLINALFYRLMDIVEPQITLILERTVGHEALEIVDRDAFEGLLTESGLSLPFEFEMFRQYLLDGFREMMLENISIKDTLNALSNHFWQHGQRPILLVDDLVQSINLFATEFLDYFITLDQGNWDVIIGITPASFQSDTRGRELLERINHLDTIDDRVDKFWLSDEQGLESYFLTETNFMNLAFAYLNAFRRLNGIDCINCPALQRCQTLQHQEVHLLAPFNEAVLQRLFRDLPAGKGKVRAFIGTLRQTLEAIIDGKRPDESFMLFSNSELAVECDDEVSAQMLKWYASQQSLSHVAYILDFFRVPQPSHIQITILSKSDINLDTRTDDDRENQDEYSRLAVRDWLEGKQVNRQLLQKLRKGIVAWLRSVQHPVALATFHYPNIARPNKILRDMLMEMDTTPPIAIEGIDGFSGIAVQRSIGHLAFQFVSLSESSGRVQQAINRKIAQDPRAIQLIWHAQHYAEQRLTLLESQLEMPLEHFALGLFLLRIILNGSPQLYPPGINPVLHEQIQGFHSHLRYFVSPLPNQLVNYTDKLFDDFFKLRDNVYDSPRLSVLTQTTIEDVLSNLSKIPQDRLDNAFGLGNIPLGDVIQKVQAKTELIDRALSSQSPSQILQLSPQGRDVLGRLQQGSGVPLGALSPKYWHDFHKQTPEFYQRMQVYLSQEGE